MQLLRGFIAGGVRNPVLVNLAMVCILVGGFLSVRGMVREVYPEFSLDHVVVKVPYPGASPDDQKPEQIGQVPGAALVHPPEYKGRGEQQQDE